MEEIIGDDEEDNQNNQNENIRKRLKEFVKAREQEQKIKQVLAIMLDGDAYQRLMTAKVANSELFARAANTIAYMYKRVGRKITEEEIKLILFSLSKRREGGIKVKRK